MAMVRKGKRGSAAEEEDDDTRAKRVRRAKVQGGLADEAAMFTKVIKDGDEARVRLDEEKLRLDREHFESEKAESALDREERRKEREEDQKKDLEKFRLILEISNLSRMQ